MAKRPDTAASIVEEYSKRQGLYRDFASCTRELVGQILSSHGIGVHSVTCRAKDADSLSGKLQKNGKGYKVLGDVTDLAGVRVITYFTDDAERVADLIEAEFSVDVDNSVDKRRLLEPHEFGYISIHHVACFSEKRLALAEYSKFRGLKVEIQTRSILQHAWAEIEHDLGYKTATQVPKQLRRRISRLAGLLELADQEFQAVRTEISNYERDLPKLVLDRPRAVDLDKSSLEAFVKQSEAVRALDKKIAEAVRSKVGPEISVDYAVTRLAWLGITHLGDLDDLLRTHTDSIVRLAIGMMPKDERDADSTIIGGTSLFYLAYVLALQKAPETLEQFVRDGMGLKSRPFVKRFCEHLRRVWERERPQRVPPNRAGKQKKTSKKAEK
jgi:ppGpp synthetase/RelA/SpoT-type nucleotidyltranferase